MNPFLFILGCPRSGTLLDGEEGVSPERPVGPELLARLAGDRRFTRMDVDHAELERLLASAAPVSYAEFVSTVFDLYGRAQHKPLVGDKVPGYVLDIPILHALFPHARFVHSIRDGRDVCSSVLDWERKRPSFAKLPTWEEDAVTTTALWWERRVRAGREAGSPLGPALYHELRYESLVGEPVAACRALCDFLGLAYDERMVEFNEGREKDEAGLSAKRAWRPITAGLRSWRSELTGEELERFEGALLDELGYPRAVPDPSPAAAEHAARVRDAFVRS